MSDKFQQPPSTPGEPENPVDKDVSQPPTSDQEPTTVPANEPDAVQTNEPETAQATQPDTPGPAPTPAAVEAPDTWKQRLFRSLLVAFAIPFTFIVVGMLQLFVLNYDYYPFDLKDLLPSVIVMAVIVFAVLFVLLYFTRKTLHGVLMSLALGVLTTGYLQGNFFNINLGPLTGDRINWDAYIGTTIWNTAICLLLLMLPFFIYYFKKRWFSYLSWIVPLLIIGMQLGNFIPMMATAYLPPKNNSGLYLSEKGILDLSSQKNILVFIVDRLDGKYVDKVKQQTPDFFDDLDGFTYYPNHTSMYCRTYPSVTYMLTGQLCMYDKPESRYFEEAYKKGRFIPELRKHNFTTKLYLPEWFTYSDPKQLEGLADNLVEGERVIDKPLMRRLMLKFVGYQYMPFGLKRFFWFTTDDMQHTLISETGEGAYNLDDFRTFRMIREQGVRISESKNNFMFLHMRGCHAPYDMNEVGLSVGFYNSDLVSQTKGTFHIIKQYLKQMKELGVYKDATIIITGDHPESNDVKSLDTYKTTGMFIKPSGSEGTPLVISRKPISSENFQATILQEAGIDTTGFGRSVFDVPDNDQTVRRFLYYLNSKVLEEYEIRGDAENFDNWKLVKKYDTAY